MIRFTTCNHTSPPAPSPSRYKRIPNQCLPCTISYAQSQSSFNVTSYNADISDTTYRYTDHARRASNKRDRDEIIDLARRKIRCLTEKRNGEVERLWDSVARKWDGGTRPGSRRAEDEVLTIVLEWNRDGLIAPRTQWKDDRGRVVEERTYRY